MYSNMRSILIKVFNKYNTCIFMGSDRRLYLWLNIIKVKPGTKHFIFVYRNGVLISRMIATRVIIL